MREDIDFLRQSGIWNPDDFPDLEVTMIGAGGIGSPTAIALAKMGVHISAIWDPDRIERHNLPNQFYRIRDIGEPKAQALQNICADFAGVIPAAKRQTFRIDRNTKGIIVSGVDSMRSRIDIWKKIKGLEKISLYIDGRMRGEVARIFTIRPNNEEDCRMYEATLHSDEKAGEVACTERAIIYNVFMVASLIARQVKRFTKSEPFPREIICDLVNLQFFAR